MGQMSAIGQLNAHAKYMRVLRFIQNILLYLIMYFLLIRILQILRYTINSKFSAFQNVFHQNFINLQRKFYLSITIYAF